MRKVIILVMLIVLCLPFFTSMNRALAANTHPQTPGTKIDPQVQAKLNAMRPGEMITVIVTLAQQTDLSRISGRTRVARQENAIRALQSTADVAQRPIRSLLKTRRDSKAARQEIPFWVFNGMSVTATREVVLELAARSDVQSIGDDAIQIVPAAPPGAGLPEANLTAINAPALWALGYSGQGVVVANMDSGVDLNHPDLLGRWRGGSNSWYDPYGQHPTTPTDLMGHGTGTMSIMVGGDAGGTSLGVAPQAQWIAVKIFNDSGSSTATAIHLGYQWLLDPDGNPATPDAPQVVNNSWALGSPGCNLQFQPDLQALRATNILPVFAAGNYGPSAYTSASPANYPEAFPVGAVDNAGQIYALSSRGPSDCGQTQGIFPKVVASGVNVLGADLFGMYSYNSGTSLAAPHIAGALALLLNAFPGLSAAQQEAALLNGAVDLGASGADNTFGYGRLDALQAYQWLQNGGSVATSTPTLEPSPTATLEPSPTPTLEPSPTPTLEPSPTPTLAPSPTTTLLPSPTPTQVPSPTPTLAASPTAPPPSPTPTASADVLFADGFESGGVGAWSAAVTGGSRLSVTGQAKLSGNYGLQALINSTSAIYVKDLTPANEPGYHARFYFSPNGTSIAANRQHDLLTGLSPSGAAVFRVQIRYASGSFQLRAVTRTNKGSETATAWYPVSNAAHAVEVAWQAATTTRSNDGALSLWVDGQLKGTRSGLANSSLRLEEVRLGPQSLVSGIAGTEYFDAFQSSRSTYIGP